VWIVIECKLHYFATMPHVRLLARRALNIAHRAASTLASRRAQLLQKKPDDIVITFAKRTAMGRAKKGQLKDVPVDELLHALFKVRVDSP
jgi:acetyl-CoA acyltransferase 1